MLLRKADLPSVTVYAGYADTPAGRVIGFLGAFSRFLGLGL
jgi:hypothetical protein